jgi:single-stranded DNA-binding protein
MDLNVAVIAGRLTATPELRRRGGAHQAIVLRLATRRPARKGQPPSGVDLVDVTVDEALAIRMADYLVKDRRIIVGGRLEHRAPKGGTPTLHVVATILQVLEPGEPPPTIPRAP